MNTFQPSPACEPVFNIPGVVLAFVAAFVAVHLWRLWALSDAGDVRFIYDYALIPARWSVAFLANGADAVMNALPPAGEAGSQWQRLIAGQIVHDRQPMLWTALTYAFLHGSWMHLFFNSIWFVAFGSPLARRWGNARFMVFCGFAALMGALVYYLVQPYSTVPTIGASGIVSGLFGASPWYLFERNIGFGRHERWQPRLTLVGLMRNRTALVFIVFWAVTVYATAALPGLFTSEDAPIAWQAHIGGFVAAFLIFPLADDRIPKA